MNLRRRSVRPRPSVLRLVALAAALAVAVPAAAAPAAAAVDDDVLKVLLFYKPNFHASHVQARQAVRDLATELAAEYDQTVEIQETEDPAAFTTANLATVDAMVFAQTGGVLFDAAQRAALEGYIRGGGGFMGLHYTGWSVGQSEHDVNPFYARLVGAMSEGHPENPAVRPGRVVVSDVQHPLTAGVPTSFTRSDEWYDWTVNPAPGRAHAPRGRRGVVRRRPPGHLAPDHVVPGDRRRPVLVLRDGPRGHRVLRAGHPHADAQRPRLRLRSAAGRLLGPVQGGQRRLERRHAVAADARSTWR